MINVSIIGATGYAGHELVKIMLKNKNVKLAALASSSAAGTRYSDHYPSLKGLCDKELEAIDTEKIAKVSDAVFMCLPHGTGIELAAAFIRKGVRIFDLSADFRLKDPALYEKTYGIRHEHPILLERAVYGLAEVNKNTLERASFVAVPGCYPTSALIPLIPLIREKLIDTSTIIIDSKSGVSGAGKKPSAKTHYCGVNENFSAYGIFSHRHRPEIEHIIELSAGQKTNIIFTPHLAPFNRGMLSTIYVKSQASEERLYAAWENFYKEGAVRIRRDAPDVQSVARTPFIDIALFQKGDDVIIVSALDNLLKGASSQAAQCFNLSYGFNSLEALI